MVQLEWTFLGRVDYQVALRLQYVHAGRVASGANPRLFLLDHPPPITLGRSADRSHLRLTPEEYAAMGFGLPRSLRGGDGTYHGPGQLVGYPVASLDAAGCRVADWVRGHAEAIIGLLGMWGISASWSDVHPGIWVGRRKIAAVGFHISRRISTHGFALNLRPDLSHYDTIVPCGLSDPGVTSMERLGIDAPGMGEVAEALAGRIARRFGWRLGPALDAWSVISERRDGVTASVANG